MTDYVLVHGAWGGGYQYNALARSLRKAGHRALIAQLTGLGARAHLASPAIDLATHVTDVVEQVRDAGLDEIVLVGHSYGGMVITGVLGQLGGKAAHAVYLDAFMPEDGQSLWDLTGEWEHEHYIDGQRETPGLVAPLPGIVAEGLSSQPLLTLLQPLRFTGRESEVARRSYVFASGWQPTPFGRFRDKVATDPAWTLHELDCGHFVMADKAAELLAILLEAAD